jgi:hypothetical protein
MRLLVEAGIRLSNSSCKHIKPVGWNRPSLARSASTSHAGKKGEKRPGPFSPVGNPQVGSLDTTSADVPYDYFCERSSSSNTIDSGKMS